MKPKLSYQQTENVRNNLHSYSPVLWEVLLFIEQHESVTQNQIELYFKNQSINFNQVLGRLLEEGLILFDAGSYSLKFELDHVEATSTTYANKKSDSGLESLAAFGFVLFVIAWCCGGGTLSSRNTSTSTPEVAPARTYYTPITTTISVPNIVYTEIPEEPVEDDNPVEYVNPYAGCCKVCDVGYACGDSCISRSKTCRKGPGCACDR
jgi:hypothetical protein